MPGGGGTDLRACARDCCTVWSPETYCSAVCAAVDRDIAAWWPDKQQIVATMGEGAAVCQAGPLSWLDARVGGAA